MACNCLTIGDNLYNFTFVGSSGFGWGEDHTQRYWYLIELMLRTDIEIFLHDNVIRRDSFKNITRSYIMQLLKYYKGCKSYMEIINYIPFLRKIFLKMTIF